MKRLLCLLVLVFFIGCVTSKEDNSKIVVTDVSVKAFGNSEIIAEVVLSGKIEIKEIKVNTVNGRTILKYPEYISKIGKVYPQVRILSEEVNNIIIESIETGKVNKSIDRINWEIVKFSPYTRENSSLKVFATVRFNDVIDVECRVFEGKYGLWISWPSRKDEKSGRWIKQVVIRKKFKELIEKILLNRYETLVEEGFDEFDEERQAGG